MDRQNKGLSVIVMILALAVVFMSVGFAAFSANLKVNGTVAVDPINWSIVFDDTTSNWTFSATKKTPTTKTQADGTTLLTNDDVMKVSDIEVDDAKQTITFSAHLYEIGDKASFVIPVKNDGNLDAKLTNITADVTCSSTVSDNCTYFKEFLDYSVTYDGTSYDAVTTPVTLDAGKSSKVGVSFEYVMPTDESHLPTGDVHDDDAIVTFTIALSYQPK